MASHTDLGKLGEQKAVDFLRERNYVILETNFIFERAEIDIIAKKDDILVVVEVKTRNSDYFGGPQEFVSPGKIKLLLKAANEYIISNDLDNEVRFDIIAILKNGGIEKIKHYKNAFYHF